MAWRTEYSRASISDLQNIFRHLVTTQHEVFGYDLTAAEQLASKRVEQIRTLAKRIQSAPFRGQEHRLGKQNLRHIQLQRAVIWFRPERDAEHMMIEGIFLAGEDHLSKMVARYLREGS